MYASQKIVADNESKAAQLGYSRTVKVNAKGQITVTLKHNRDGHVFEGFSSQSTRYDAALTQAVNRMLDYENRLG